MYTYVYRQAGRQAGSSAGLRVTGAGGRIFSDPEDFNVC